MSVDNFNPTNYFQFESRSVFIQRDPGEERPHKISVMKDGSFRVFCTHRFYDEGNIRAQIRNYMEKDKKTK